MDEEELITFFNSSASAFRSRNYSTLRDAYLVKNHQIFERIFIRDVSKDNEVLIKFRKLSEAGLQIRTRFTLMEVCTLIGVFLVQ